MKRFLFASVAILAFALSGFAQSSITTNIYPAVGSPCYVANQKIIVVIGSVQAVFQCSASTLTIVQQTGPQFSGGTPTGEAGGDLTGTYPNPGVALVNGAVVPASTSLLGANSLRQIVASPNSPQIIFSSFSQNCSGVSSCGFGSTMPVLGKITITAIRSYSQTVGGGSCSTLPIVTMRQGTLAASGNLTGATINLATLTGSQSNNAWTLTTGTVPISVDPVNGNSLQFLVTTFYVGCSSGWASTQFTISYTMQ